MSFGDIKFNRGGTVAVPDFTTESLIDFYKSLNIHSNTGSIPVTGGTVTGIYTYNTTQQNMEYCGNGGGGRWNSFGFSSIENDIPTEKFIITNSGGSLSFTVPQGANAVQIGAQNISIEKEILKTLEYHYEQAIKDTSVIEEVKQPEYVNVMLMDEVHKIDKDKLWASIRAFGDGGSIG